MLMDWKLNVNFAFTYLLEIIFVEEIKILHLVELQMKIFPEKGLQGLCKLKMSFERGFGRLSTSSKFNPSLVFHAEN